MGSRDLEYAYPTDDLSRSFTATLISGTQSTGYEPVRLTNDDPSYPFKVDSTTFRLLWDFGTPKTIKYALLVHHNFVAGLSGVRLAMGSTTATTDFSRDFTIRTYHEDDFPVNEHLDLRDINPSYQYLSLELTAANSVNAALGKIALLSSVRNLDGNLELSNVQDDETHPLVEHRTDVGVSTIYIHGTRWRWLRGDKIQVASDSALIRSWNRAANGRGLPFVVIPHIETDADAGAVEESMLVRFEKEELPRTYIGPDLLSRWRLEFEETSRGLKPTPSAV